MATEESLLLDKNVKCPICRQMFQAKVLKSGKVRRKESDWDLRPRAYDVDILKYEAISCPHCGYTAMHRDFERLSNRQIKEIKEKICAHHIVGTTPQGSVYTYEDAWELYKKVLANEIAKQAKASDVAYCCLNMSWLLRGRADELPDGIEKENIKANEEAFYKKAFEGFLQAVQKEYFPMCGMDQTMIEYLLACMAFHFKKYDIASQSVSNILANRVATGKIKDRALELKKEIVNELRQSK